MASTRCEELLGISDALFTKKRGWDGLCQEIAEHFYPLRSDFTENFTLGRDFSEGIMDSSSVHAREELGNAVDAMLRQGDWFKIGTGDEDRDKRPANARSLEGATKLYKGVLRDKRTGMSAATKQMDHDWVAFGQACYSWEEAPSRDHLVLRAWHPKSCAWLLDETDHVSTFFRKFTMTARNVKARVASGRWKPETGRLHQDFDLAARTEPDREFNFLHVLMPIEDAYGSDGKKLREIRHPFLSIYIDTEHREYMSEAGTPVFNYGAPRWRTLTGVPQGFSPAAVNALGDARMLQSMAAVIIEQAEKAVDPPLIGVGDIFTRDLNFMAGGFTMVDLPDDVKLQDKMTTLETSGGLRVGVELKQDVRELIAESFLLNKLYLPSAREMREVEVMVRTEEFRRAALPFFSPIEHEYHAPMLDTGLQMALNMRLIPPDLFGEELYDQDTEFSFNTPLNEADGRKMVDALFSAINVLAATQEIDNTVANQFDMRQATLDAVKGGGAPASWILPEAKQKQKAAEAEQQKALAQGAQVAREAAGVVADSANAGMAAQQVGML